jgi:hypothetical protein
MTHHELRYPINLLQDGTVVTKDGEFLGTWGTDESDAIYEFTPDGADSPTLSHPFMRMLCDQIEEWHLKQEG